MLMTLSALLDGATFANALRRSGKPCRIQLPDNSEAHDALVLTHLDGAPSTLKFQADGCEAWNEHVDAVVLAAFCPAADGLCRWLGIDLDATDHGDRGLADPVRAMRCIAERAANAGLAGGLLTARSRRGQGRHVFLLLPAPAVLLDAVIGVGALAAAAFKVAKTDTEEGSVPHAFRRTNGSTAQPGDSGAVELIPRSTDKPSYGWPLTLPGAGVFRAQGGGVIVDPFTDKPRTLEAVPRCDPQAWAEFVAEAHPQYAQSRRILSYSRPSSTRNAMKALAPLDRVDPRTQDFIDGRVPQGSRNSAAFASSANLLGCGVSEAETERLILSGADACGLPEREARAAFRSAMKARTRGGGRA